MKLIGLVLLSIIAVGATIEVRTSLGFSVANATVCVASQCVTTNATGHAEVAHTGPAEVYIDGILAWKTYATGHDIVTVTYLQSLEAKPLAISGKLVVKMVKLVNGTYVDLEIPFAENALARKLPVGNINYQLEVYILRIGDYILGKPVKVSTTLWEPKVDLTALGLVKMCQIKGIPPVTAITLNATHMGRDITAYLITGLNYTGVADTDIRLPNGSRYRLQFKLAEFCNKTLGVNATRLVIRAVDSFGAVRTDWTIAVAGGTYRGQAELWVLPGVVYTVTVDAGFTKKTITVTTRQPSEALIVEVENAYLLLEYQQPPKRVIIGNYTLAEAAPRRIELPPGNYTVIADIGGRNFTYTVTLKPGQALRLVVGQATVNTQTATNPIYIFASAVLVIAAYILLRGIPRRRQLTRGQSHS
ncbi:hypothetical protein [Pyrobaculum aerophilum]|uniref:hypothetical protein n=1 Tax=Pyrobaculum aerophilum TaxID=13773 RepID=UPI002FDAC91D